jgi:transposase
MQGAIKNFFTKKNAVLTRWYIA